MISLPVQSDADFGNSLGSMGPEDAVGSMMSVSSAKAPEVNGLPEPKPERAVPPPLFQREEIKKEVAPVSALSTLIQESGADKYESMEKDTRVRVYVFPEETATQLFPANFRRATLLRVVCGRNQTVQELMREALRRHTSARLNLFHFETRVMDGFSIDFDFPALATDTLIADIGVQDVAITLKPSFQADGRNSWRSTASNQALIESLHRASDETARCCGKWCSIQ